MHVRLIDGNSVGFALHHANDIRRGAGQQVHAVEAFLLQMRRWRQSEKETLHVVLWDGRAQWRRDLAPEYLSGPSQSDEHRVRQSAFELQRPWIRRLLQAMPVVQVVNPRLDAEDLAFALSNELSAQGHLVSLFTANLNWLQCVRQRVSWANARKKAQVVDDLNFRRETGCPSPQAYVDVKALAGDTTDNLEGAPGIKEALAKEIITEYGSLSALWKAGESPFFQGPKQLLQACLPEVRARVQRNKLLRDLSAAPLPDCSLTETTEGEFDDLDIYEVLVDLELTGISDSFDSFKKGLDTSLTREQTSTFRRAVANMNRSYPKPEPKG